MILYSYNFVIIGKISEILMHIIKLLTHIGDPQGIILKSKPFQKQKGKIARITVLAISEQLQGWYRG